MICRSCGTKNNEYHRFCYQCGAELPPLNLIDNQAGHDQSANTKEEPLTSYPTAGIPMDMHPINSTEDDSVLDALIPNDPTEGITEIVSDDITSNKTDAVADNPTTGIVEKWSVNAMEDAAEDRSDSIIKEVSDNRPDDSGSKTLSSFDETEDAWSNLFMNNMSESRGEEEFNLQSQLPLRRYRKPERDESGLPKVIKAFVYLIAFALVGVLLYVGYGLLKQLQPREQPTVKQIDFDFTVEEIAVDGNSARKILVKTSIGEQVKLLDKAAPVIRGNAEFILPDKDFALAGIYDEIDGALQVALTITAIADGYPDRTEEIHLQVPIQGAPLKLISPSMPESIVDGDSIQLILNVLPHSDIRINDNSYTHLLDSQGQLSVQLEVPDQEETIFEIRVAALGYEETVETLVLKKQQMEFPLVVDQPVPIQALSTGEWVEVTGNTHPGATLSTNLVLREDAMPDPVTGDFTLYVRATTRGLTPFVLTAKLEGNEDSFLDMIIERPVNEGEYTRSAWAPSYQEFKSYPNLHHGTSYVFAGTVKEILSTGTKTTLLVDVAPQGQNEQLIYVEYWRTGRYTIDQKVRIFGNYWGSKDDNPYVLAYFIYE